MKKVLYIVFFLFCINSVVAQNSKANLFGLLGSTYESVNEAYLQAVSNAEKEDLIFIGGSTFVVAEVV